MPSESAYHGQVQEFPNINTNPSITGWMGLCKVGNIPSSLNESPVTQRPFFPLGPMSLSRWKSLQQLVRALSWLKITPLCVPQSSIVLHTCFYIICLSLAHCYFAVHKSISILGVFLGGGNFVCFKFPQTFTNLLEGRREAKESSFWPEFPFNKPCSQGLLFALSLHFL